jgi:hypothetical protein
MRGCLSLAGRPCAETKEGQSLPRSVPNGPIGPGSAYPHVMKARERGHHIQTAAQSHRHRSATAVDDAPSGEVAGRAQIPGGTMRAYLDTNILSAIATNDTPREPDALGRLSEARPPTPVPAPRRAYKFGSFCLNTNWEPRQALNLHVGSRRPKGINHVTTRP